MLLLWAEKLNVRDNRRDDGARRLLLVPLQRIHKTLFSELLSVRIKGLRHAIGIERKDIAGRELGTLPSDPPSL